MHWVQRLLLATVVALVTAAPAQAAFSGNNGKIVFERSNQIVVQDPNGTQHVIASGNAPRWSPDGTKIAYSAEVGTQCGGVTGSNSVVRVMNADGSGQRTLSPASCTPVAKDPAWSPDGTRIVYVGPNGTFPAGTDIFTVAATGGAAKRLTNDASINEHPSWSSLNKIAWSRNFGGPGVHEYRI